jgi:16S rRNA (cytosine967-C5)-methyltransferase
MRDAARLQAVIELLDTIEKTPRPSDTLISAYFRARRYIGAKDRSAIASETYDIMRHHARLGWWVEYLKSHLRGGSDPRMDDQDIDDEERTERLRAFEQKDTRFTLLVYLSLVQNKPPELIIKLFNGEKFAPLPLTQEEEKFLRELKGRTLIHPHMSEAVQLECPDWAYEKLKATLGGKLKAEMQALQTSAPLDVRVNPVKATREEAQRRLNKEGISAAPTPLSPYGLRLQGRPPLAQSAAFREGLIEIQDEGSQMVALLVDAKPGMRVADFCAGAGGKTLAIAAMMENKGQVVACDVLGGRLKRARTRFSRAGLDNIEVRELKNENDEWVKRNAGKFDRVLVDAPCSGTGTWRRNPDARWKHLGPGLEELLPLQASILKNAARLVKKGGRLVYATCSLLEEENAGQIEAFLKDHTDFEKVPQEKGEFLVLSPARHGTDGFFGAVLQKN